MLCWDLQLSGPTLLHAYRRGGRQDSHLCYLDNLLAASQIILDCSRRGSAHHASTARNTYCAHRRCRVKRKRKSYPANPVLRPKFSTSVHSVGQPVSNLVPTLFLSLFAVTPRRSFPAFCFLPLFAVTPLRSLSAFCFCFRCSNSKYQSRSTAYRLMATREILVKAQKELAAKSSLKDTLG